MRGFFLALLCAWHVRSESELYASNVLTLAQFRNFSVDGGGFGAAGRSMKVLVDARGGGTATRVFFINGNYRDKNGIVPDFAKFHYDFAVKVLDVAESLDEFNAATYFTDQKRFFAGTVQSYELGQGRTILALQCYPDDVIHEDGVVQFVSLVGPHVNVPGMRRAFVAGGPQQTFATVATQLAGLGFDAFNISEVLGDVEFLPLNPGEAFGYLRIFPASQADLTPTDIAVFDELPLDLTVVAATVTRAFQDITSHVNLKSKERGTPNMVYRLASTSSGLLAPFANQPVRLVVGKGNFTIEPSTAEVVQAKYAERLAQPWQALPYVRQNASMRFDDMCPRIVPRCVNNGPLFGGKAGMLGFLVKVLGRTTDDGSPSQRLGYDIVPRGFGAPLTWYRQLVAANPVLNATLESLISQERAGLLSPRQRAALAAKCQALFYRAVVPPAIVADLKLQLAELKRLVPGLKKLKCRSSANAEDVVGFDGAGLHDSFSVKLKVVVVNVFVVLCV